MCGIAGYFAPRGAVPEAPDWPRMLASTAHRGPDGTGSYVSPDRRFQAGFNRLAIIDLVSGDQPIVEDGGRRVLMGNGEIYNYVELRNQDAARAYPFQTQGDMEVVLPLETRYGDRFVDHLNGMFALALYKTDDHSLTLVRDRLGVKPLYWTKLANGAVLFASEIKALFASGLIAPRVDEAQVPAYLAHGYVPGPDTFYQGVRKLEPGHVLRVDENGGIDIEAYWRPGPAAFAPGSIDEAAEHLSEMLKDSVRLQLRSDVPVGAMLSGGLDSGLMVAMAAQHASGALNTFTVRFEGDAIDETPLARAIAEKYATNHRQLELPTQSILAHFPNLIWFLEEPMNDAALLPNFLIEQLLGEHVTVALNGTGGDELFAGYGRYFQLPVEARYLGLPASVRRRAVEPIVDAIDPMTAWKLRRAAKFDANRGAYIHDHATQFPPPMLSLIDAPAPAGPSRQETAFAAFDGPKQTAALVADIQTYLCDDLLLLLDRTSMAVSVEGRVPFLDHRLVEAALAVPPGLRTPGGRQKALERRMARPLLPAEVVAAPKQGFASPVPAWIESGLGAVAKRILTRTQSLERGWWSRRGIENLFADPGRHAFRIYSLLTLEMCVRVHVEGPVAERPGAGDLEYYAEAA